MVPVEVWVVMTRRRKKTPSLTTPNAQRPTPDKHGMPRAPRLPAVHTLEHDGTRNSTRMQSTGDQGGFVLAPPPGATSCVRVRVRVCVCVPLRWNA